MDKRNKKWNIKWNEKWKAKRKTKWLMSTKKTLSFIMLIILLCTMTGCNQTDKIKQDMTDSKDKKETGKNGDALGIDIPEKLSMDVADENGALYYKVSADVKIADGAVAGVYQEEATKTDIQYVNELAEKIFDGGKSEQIKPLGCYTVDELKAEKETLLNQLKTNKEEFVPNKTRYTDILCLLEYDRIGKFKTADYKEGDFSGVGDGWNVATYILEGEIQGVPYQICAYKGDPATYSDQTTLKLGSNLHIVIANMKEGYDELQTSGVITDSAIQLAASDDVTDDTIDELGFSPLTEENSPLEGPVDWYYDESTINVNNHCQYDEGSASEMAQSFLETCLDESFLYDHFLARKGSYATRYTFKDLEEEERNPEALDGYVMTFYRTKGNLPCTGVLASEQEEVQKAMEEHKSSWLMDENYEVEVSDLGVTRVKLPDVVLTSGDAVTENCALLDFSELTSVVEQQLKDTIPIWKANNYIPEDGTYARLIDGMELTLVSINHNGELSICPAWKLTYDNGSGPETEMLINAMDGSLIWRTECIYEAMSFS